LDQKNSPSRFRFRPPVALTFGFRLLPSPLASTYSRPVLGASGNLAMVKGSIKSLGGGKNRYLRAFQFSTFSTACSPSVDSVLRPWDRGGE
jgi:hypothetical protein